MQVYIVSIGAMRCMSYSTVGCCVDSTYRQRPMPHAAGYASLSVCLCVCVYVCFYFSPFVFIFVLKRTLQFAHGQMSVSHYIGHIQLSYIRPIGLQTCIIQAYRPYYTYMPRFQLNECGRFTHLQHRVIRSMNCCIINTSFTDT